MFFKIYNMPKYMIPFRAVASIVLFCFIITINGCTTTSSVRYPGEKLATNKITKEVTCIVTKNGEKINTQGKKIIYSDSIKSIIILDYDTNVTINKIMLKETNIPGIYDTVKGKETQTVKSSGKNKIIPLNNILEAFVEKTETDVGLTTLFVVGMIGVAVLTVILIKNATEPYEPTAPPPPPPPDTTTGGGSSCPLVYSFDGEKYVFDGEPISGVISESLMRSDHSRLEKLRPSGGKFKLRITNQPGEKEMLDELRLICVSHEENTFVTPNPEGEFFNYKKIISPESVTDENGNDVSLFFKEKDDVRWQTLMPVDTSFYMKSIRHSLKFRFHKPAGVKNALLFLNCGTAYWGSAMIKNVLQLKGEKVDDWYGNLFSGNIEMQKLFKFIVREELFGLKVNLLEGDKYNTRTFIPAGGPLIDDDRVIRLPLENVTSDYVEFILNPPEGFWKIDQIGIIYDYEVTGKDKIRELEAVFAEDQSGRDIRKEIRNKDKVFYPMPDYGDHAIIYYDVPEKFSVSENEIFLKTTGFYEIYINKAKKEQTALVEELLTTPGIIIEYSMKIYKQSIGKIVENMYNH